MLKSPDNCAGGEDLGGFIECFPDGYRSSGWGPEPRPLSVAGLGIDVTTSSCIHNTSF
jgi:hypothetical protein